MREVLYFVSPVEFSTTAGQGRPLGRPRPILLSDLFQDFLARLGIRLDTHRGLNQLRQLAEDKPRWSGNPGTHPRLPSPVLDLSPAM